MRLEECERGDELEREGRGVSPRVSQQRGQQWLQTGDSPAWVSAKVRGARESENLLISCCTFSSVRGVTVVDVGEKLFVRLVVAGGFGEIKAHERDEGVDVLDGQWAARG